MNPDDVNQDGISDWQDVQARNRRLDQEDSARAVREIGATLGQGVRNLGAAFAGLWRNVTSLPGRVLKVARRAHVRLVVQLIPEDVTDADTLYDLTWQIAPADATDEHYRRTICVLATKERTAEEDAQFVQYLRGCKAYGQDPIRTWIERARAKRTVRALPPRATVEPASMPMGFAAMPAAAVVNGLSLSQVFAVVAVVFGALAWWGWDTASDNAAKVKEVTTERDAAIDAANQNAAAARAERDARVSGEAAARAEAEKSSKLAANANRRLADARRKEKRYVEEITGSVGGGPPPDWDERLRDFRAPQTLFGDPAGSAAPAPGPAGGVHDAAPAAPGTSGADAPAAAPGDAAGGVLAQPRDAR